MSEKNKKIRCEVIRWRITTFVMFIPQGEVKRWNLYVNENKRKKKLWLQINYLIFQKISPLFLKLFFAPNSQM